MYERNNAQCILVYNSILLNHYLGRLRAFGEKKAYFFTPKGQRFGSGGYVMCWYLITQHQNHKLNKHGLERQTTAVHGNMTTQQSFILQGRIRLVRAK
jgi:hypothetical protein